MHGCRVTFSIPGKGDAKWVEGYDGATDVEIKELIVECGFVLASLQDELLCRLGREETKKVRDNLTQLTICEENLKACAKRIQDEGLSYDDLKQFTNQPANETDQLDRSVEVIKVGLGHVLSKSRGSWTSDTYAEFIWLVSTVISPDHALLLKCSSTRKLLKALNSAQKAKLIQHIKKNEVDFTCEAIRGEATKLGLYNYAASRKRRNDEVLPRPSTLRRRTSTRDADLSSNSISTISSSGVPNPVSAISSHTISPSSEGDVDSPPGSLVSSPQDSLLTTSSSQHHTLISPSTAETREVLSTRSDLIGLKTSAVQTNRVFDCIQTDHPSDSDYLLLLFHPLGGCEIPYALIERAQSRQYRWSKDGHQTQMTALEAGLDQQFVDLLSDETRLTQTIHKLDPLLKLNTSTKGSWTCSIQSELKIKLSQSLNEWTREEWAIKLLKWICFTFPRDQFPSDPDQSLSVGKQLLPLLNLALGQVIQKSLPTCLRDDAAGALLAASRIGDMSSRQNAVTLATKVLGDQPPEHLQVALAHQKSTLLRIAADWNQSEHIIRELCRRTAGLDHSGDVIQYFYRHLQPSMESKILNALYGRLHISHLENLVQSEHYRTAAEEIEDWRISQEPSLMEQCVFRSKTVVVAKLFRCQGRFHDVVHTLEECLKLPFPQMNRIQLICSLADAHCDLGSPDVAHARLKTEIEAQRKKSARGKQFRRLWVCAIDADLERGWYDSAQKTVQEIETIYSGLSDLDATDQLLHVRVLLAAARIYFYKEQFSEALGAFKVLINRVQEYRSLKSDGFVYALAHLSICLVNLKTGSVGECKKSFNYARTIIYREWPDFWIPTAPRWLRYISSEINSMTGWTLMTRTPLIPDASGAFLTSIT
ncbi:hypothetical protein B0O99DRAFT_677972 [Bisporella sp. PMI_857]|nr:hypothetical protein B0O99DRAFT_677972 [Bisporella sp. PMI_857]